MKDRSVTETEFADYFPDLGDHDVRVLSAEDARSAWVSLVDDTASSYYELPDGSWVVASPSRSVGSWICAYNDDDRAAGRVLLEGAVRWFGGQEVFFMAKKHIVLRTSWRSFCALWDDFLALEDDCPLLLQVGGDDRQALLFRPIGDVIRIN